MDVFAYNSTQALHGEAKEGRVMEQLNEKLVLYHASWAERSEREGYHRL